MGSEPRIFTWFAAHALARTPLPEWLIPNAVVSAVGLQTAYAMDDCGVRTEPANGVRSGADGRLFIQSKSGLKLSDKATSDLAAAIDQAVAQWHAGIPGQALQEERDRLVIVTDAAAPASIRIALDTVVNHRLATAADEHAGRNEAEEEALRALRTHVERAWRARSGQAPSADELMRFHSVLRILVLDLDEGRPDRGVAEQLLGRALGASEHAAHVWESLTTIGQALNERQQWLHRRHLIQALRHRGYILSDSAVDRVDKGVIALLQAQVRAAELFSNHLVERPASAEDSYVRQSILSTTPTSSDAPRLQPFHEVLARPDPRHLLIVGEAGLGKSTLTRQEAARLAQRALDGPLDDDPWLRPLLLPLQVSALDLVETEGPLSTRVMRAVAKALGPYLEHELPQDLLAATPDVPWLLMIDGLDEIGDPRRLLRMVKTLAAFARQGGGPRMVITTRPLQPDHMKPLHDAGFATYALQYLDHRQLTGFARSWFGDEAAAGRFLAQAGRPEMRDLVRIPLMATLAAMLHEEHPGSALPTDRYTLYRSFLNLLRESRSGTCVQRGEDPRPTEPALQAVREQMDDLVHHLAQCQVTGSTGDLLPEAVAWTEREVGQRETGRMFRWPELVSKTLTDTGLFVRTGSGLRFVHLSFAEFLAAEANAVQLPMRFDAEEAVWRDALTRALRAQSRYEVWARPTGVDTGSPQDNVDRETLVHRTYLLPGSAAALAGHLQPRGRNGQLLAGYLLGEGSAASAESERAPLVAAFLDHLRDAVHREDGPLGAWFQAAGRIRSARVAEHLRALAEDRGRTPRIRAEAARALADSRPHQAVKALRSIADDEQTDPNCLDDIVRTLLDIDPTRIEWAADTLRRLYRHPWSSPESICRAAEVLASLGETYVDEAAAVLLSAATCTDAAPSDRLDAARLLSDLGPPAYHQPCVQALWDVVDSPHADVLDRTEALQELRVLDVVGADQVGETLIAFLSEGAMKVGQVHGAVAMIIATSPDRLGEVLTSLHALAENPDAPDAVRRAAATELRSLQPREAGPGSLRPATEPDPSSLVERMCRVLADPDEELDRLQYAAEELGESGPAASRQGVLVLRRRITEAGRGHELLDLARVMAELGPAYRPEAAAVLQEAIATASMPSALPARAARILIDLGPDHAEEAYAVLRSIADDPSVDEDTQDGALLGMGLFRPEYAHQVAGYLRTRIAASRSASPARHRVLAGALASLGPRWAEEAACVLRGLVHDDAVPGDERVECAASLAAIGHQYEVEATAWLRAFMKDRSQPADSRDLSSDRLSEITEKYHYEQDQVMRETSPELYAALTTGAA
ncbi:NACHT domain-containing protein [Kitasatospora sp. NPDC003701]